MAKPKNALTFVARVHSANNIKDKLRRWAAIIGSFVSVGSLSACAASKTQKGATVSIRSPEAVKAFVRKVDFSRTPELKELAARARHIGNEMYPKVLALLADDPSKLPQHFDIVFKKYRQPTTGGTTQSAKISLDAKWFARNPGYLDMLLIHEMAHVTQDIKWYRSISRKSVCWGEGIAEFVRYKLGYTNGRRCPWCSANYPHYTSGYSCAGAFLLYVDATYGSQVVRQLNEELRRRSYSDKFFATATGKSLGELWAEFQHTTAFTPIAAQVDKLYNAIGYVDGKPPRNVRARFNTYLNQHGEAAHFVLTRGHARVEAYLNRQGETSGLSMAYEINGDLANDVLRVYALYQYLKEAAKAAECVVSLMDQGQLPGFLKGELEGLSSSSSDLESDCEVYPMSRTLTCTKKGDPAKYHYAVVQASKDGAWKLQKAWRTDPDGRVLEEYSVP